MPSYPGQIGSAKRAAINARRLARHNDRMANDPAYVQKFRETSRRCHERRRAGEPRRNIGPLSKELDAIRSRKAAARGEAPVPSRLKAAHTIAHQHARAHSAAAASTSRSQVSRAQPSRTPAQAPLPLVQATRLTDEEMARRNTVPEFWPNPCLTALQRQTLLQIDARLRADISTGIISRLAPVDTLTAMQVATVLRQYATLEEKALLWNAYVSSNNQRPAMPPPQNQYSLPSFSTVTYPTPVPTAQNEPIWTPAPANTLPGNSYLDPQLLEQSDFDMDFSDIDFSDVDLSLDMDFNIDTTLANSGLQTADAVQSQYPLSPLSPLSPVLDLADFYARHKPITPSTPSSRSSSSSSSIPSKAVQKGKRIAKSPATPTRRSPRSNRKLVSYAEDSDDEE